MKLSRKKTFHQNIIIINSISAVTEDTGGGSSLNTGQLAGIVVASVAGVLVLVLIVASVVVVVVKTGRSKESQVCVSH